MKKNCFGVLFGFFGLLSSQAIFALGLGDITTQSALNQPLVAEIELINVGSLESTQILVGIGTDSDYALAGVTREFFHSDLEFEVFAEGSNPRIVITSERPLQDPYLNIMIQARWPQGKILREYTLLLDMPIFSQQQAQTSPSSASSAAVPSTARQASQAQAAAQSTQVEQVTQVRTQPVRSSSASTSATTPVQRISSNSDYQVSEGETLWGISGRVAQSAGIGRHQAMLAIHEQNPDAFVNGNIHALKAGVSLGVPSNALIAGRSESEAVRDFRAIGGEVGATPLSASTNTIGDGSSGQGSNASGRLALSSSSDSSVGGLLDTESEAQLEEARNAVAETLTENAELKEQLDAAEIEKQDLQERIANLEEQIQLTEELGTEESVLTDLAIEVNDDSLDLVEEAQTALEIEEPAEVVAPAPVAPPEPAKSFLEKYLIPVLVGAGSLIVLALIAAFMFFKRKSGSDHDDLLLGDDYVDTYEDEVDPAVSAGDGYDDEDEFDDDEESDSAYSDEHEEAIDELLSADEDDQSDEAADADDIQDEAEQLAASSSFDEADDADSDEFGDLDDFFSDEASDATNVIFGEEDAGEETETTEVQDEVSELEEIVVADTPTEQENVDSDTSDSDDNELEFELGDLDLGEETSEVLVEADDELDLENSFDFTESNVADDLGEKAEADFSESLEMHTPEMAELLVPSDEDESVDADAEIDLGDDDLANLDEPDLELDVSVESDAEDVEDALASVAGDELESLEDDLGLDDDMSADLGDLDFDDAELDDLDGDEEFITKLELAEAYIEMGDVQGAKELLAEVEKDGTEEQKTAAKDLLERTKT